MYEFESSLTFKSFKVLFIENVWQNFQEKFFYSVFRITKYEFGLSGFYNPSSPVSEVRISRYMICSEHVHWKCTFAIKTYKPQLRRTLAFLTVKRNKSMKPASEQGSMQSSKLVYFSDGWLQRPSSKSHVTVEKQFISVLITYRVNSRSHEKKYVWPPWLKVFNIQIYWNLLIRGNIRKKTKGN